MQQFLKLEPAPDGGVHTGMLENTRLIALSIDPIEIRLQKLALRFGQSYTSSLASPFPCAYYQSLLRSIDELAIVGGLTSEAVAVQWEFLVRLALYMSLKRIPISKYGPCLLANDSLRKQLDVIPFASFGPVGCRVANFYCFLSLGSAVGQMRDLLAGQLGSLEQHFKAIAGEVAMGEEKFFHSLDSDQLGVQNYFLETCPSEEQWACFLEDLHKRGNSDIFYQLIVIAEPKQSLYSVKQKTFPCSLETIANAYLEAYLPYKNQRLLKDKVYQLRKVTQQLHGLSANVLPPCKRIYCLLHSRPEEPMIESAIRPILAGESAEEKAYYLLIARMEKHRLEGPQWELDPALAAILVHAHVSLPTLP